jgi:5-methylcytosine-specific restriction endonuclease McrA
MRAHVWIRMQRRDAWIAQGKRCAYCRGAIKEHEITADHVVARARGGTDEDNIVAACRDCNRAKGSKSVPKFKRLLRRKSGLPFDLALIRSRRRINLAGDRSVKRILASVGLV